MSFSAFVAMRARTKSGYKRIGPNTGKLASTLRHSRDLRFERTPLVPA